MKSSIKKVIFIAITLAFISLGNIVGEEISSSVDESSPPVQAFILMQTAINNGDYETAWELTAESCKQSRFGGDFEKFKKHYSNPKKRQRFSMVNVQAIKFLSPQQVVLTVSQEPYKGVYMVQENGDWKFAGKTYEEREEEVGEKESGKKGVHKKGKKSKK